MLSAILGKERWATVALGFIRDHRCRTPLFTEIPREFLGWLDTMEDGALADVPFFRELAHYEWVESALDLSPATLPEDGIDPRGDLLLGRPVLSPLAWPLRYRYPVHRLSPDYRPVTPPEAASCFVAWRNRADVVRFMSVNAPTLRLVELMRDTDARTGRELLALIAAELPDTPEAVVLEGGREALETLRAVEVILGVRAACESPTPPRRRS